MTTREAIGIVARELKEELVVCTTGYTCRDMQSFGDRQANFYMIGSMGNAASIGLGIALAQPDVPVVVFDGDGSVLMGLGVCPMVGSLRPKNLVHIVFDNEVFASTGSQPTYSKTVDLSRVAEAAGYPVVKRVETSQELLSSWRLVRDHSGPSFLLVKCQKDAGPPMERVRAKPEALASRFMEVIQGVGER